MNRYVIGTLAICFGLGLSLWIWPAIDRAHARLWRAVDDFLNRFSGGISP